MLPSLSDDVDWPIIILQAIGAMYSFVALVIVCDQYFMPSIESSLKRFGIQNDVAGATIVAIGSSGPEFLTAALGVFVSSDDQSITDNFSTAVHNLTFVIGICALCSRTDRPLTVTWWPLLRDLIFFVVAVGLLVYSAENKRIFYWESMALLLLYISYLVFMVYNQKVKNFVMGKLCKENAVDSVAVAPTLASAPTATAKPQQLPLEAFSHGHGDPKPVENWNRIALVGAGLIWPIKLILNLTLPKSNGTMCSIIWGYLGSIIWITILSFLLVKWIDPVGDALDIPSEILVAVTGGALPELINSVLIARKGHGNMIVSAVLGSSIVDICVGLPLPWLIFSLYFGQPMWVAEVQMYPILLFGGVVFMAGISIMCFRWRLTKGYGIILLCLYVLFTVLNALFEYGVLEKF